MAGKTVEVALLTEGAGTRDPNARVLLVGRPALKHLEYYLAKHGLSGKKVGVFAGRWGSRFL